MAYVPNLTCRTYTPEPKPTNDKRTERSSYYSDSRWKYIREAKLKEMPFCEVCLNKKHRQFVPATQIHHLNSFMNGLTDAQKLNLFVDYSNLVSICNHCHSTLHRYLQNRNLSVDQTLDQVVEIVERVESEKPHV